MNRLSWLAHLLAALPLLAPAEAAQGPSRFVCPPCGVDCHCDSYPAAGNCPGCGMALVPGETVTNVAVLLFERVDLLSFALPASVLQAANAGRVFTVADSTDPVRAQDFQTVVPEYSFANAPRIDVLIVPGGSGVRDAIRDEVLLRWVEEVAGRARCVLSVDVGIAVLAHAGVLHDETVAAPAFVTRLLAERVPEVTVDADRSTTQFGRIFTARDSLGAMTQALFLAEAIGGREGAERAAERCGMAWQPSEDAVLPAAPAAPVSRPDPPADEPAQERTDRTRPRGEVEDGRDWPTWRGPAADGVSTEANWSDRGVVAWRVDVGVGHSAVAVVGDRVFTVGFDAARDCDVVWCLAADDGAVVWTHTYPATLNALGHGGGSLTTPALRDGRVYVTHRTGEVRCLGAENGELLWHVPVAREYGLKGTEYGFGASPLLVEDLVVYQVAAIVALDAGTGELRWRTRDFEAMYSTPTPFEREGRKCIVAFTKQGVYLLDRGSGDELGFHPFRKGGGSTVNASSPVVIDDRVFVSSGYDHGAAMLRVDDSGLRVLWESRVMRTKLGGCVLHREHLYGFDETTLKCIDLDGNERWRKRGFGQGALSIAGDRLLVTTSGGQLVIADADPADFHERAQVNLFSGGTCWTSPVVSHGRVYVRCSLGELVCLDHR